jgi:hypothetical protein
MAYWLFVTLAASIYDACMVKTRACKCHSGVTIFTLIGRLRVSHRFLVTGVTTIDHPSVIKFRAFPRAEVGMTVFTVIGGLNMASWLVVTT